MAQIVGVHGVRGMVKLKLFGENPDALTAYGPLEDETGKHDFTLANLQPHGTIWLATIDGLSDRTAAEKLRGTKLFLQRDKLPEIKDEKTYYHADLIGMTAKDTEGQIIGKVIGVANFGAGDLLDVKPPKGNSFYVPFTDAIVPAVDLDKNELTIDAPPGLID